MLLQKEDGNFVVRITGSRYTHWLLGQDGSDEKYEKVVCASLHTELTFRKVLTALLYRVEPTFLHILSQRTIEVQARIPEFRLPDEDELRKCGMDIQLPSCEYVAQCRVFEEGGSV